MLTSVRHKVSTFPVHYEEYQLFLELPVFLKEKLQLNERMNLLLKVYIVILRLFLAALLRSPSAIGRKHLGFVMVLKGHDDIVYSF